MLSFCVAALGQGRSGYVIDSAGVRHSGFIEPGQGGAKFKQCDFMDSVSGKRESFSPNQISAYGVDDGEHFVSETIEENNIAVKRFLKVDVEGPMNLYVYFGRFFVRKEDNFFELTNSPEKRYRLTLEPLVRDCDAGNILQSAFNEPSLTRLVERYNHCREGGVEAIKSTHLLLFATVSGEKSNYYNFDSNLMTFPYGYVRDHVRPAYGLKAIITSTRHDNFELSFGILNKERKFYGTGLSLLDIRDVLIMNFNEMDFDADVHILSHAIHGDMNRGRIYALVGLRTPFLLRSKVDLQTEKAYTYSGRATLVINYFSNIIESATMGMRTVFGLGYHSNLSKKIRWYSDCTFDLGRIKLNFNQTLPFINYHMLVWEMGLTGGITF